MQAEKFRATQGPLRDRYQTDPKAAHPILKAKGTVDDATVTCKVEPGCGLAVAGTNDHAGDLAIRHPSRERFNTYVAFNRLSRQSNSEHSTAEVDCPPDHIPSGKAAPPPARSA